MLYDKRVVNKICISGAVKQCYVAYHLTLPATLAALLISYCASAKSYAITYAAIRDGCLLSKMHAWLSQRSPYSFPQSSLYGTGLRPELLNERLTSLSNDTLAVVDMAEKSKGMSANT